MDTEESRQRQATAFEMRCYRRILHIRWQHIITIEEVWRRMKCQRIVLQMVMERKLNLFGHICQMNNSRLIKQVILGMVNGSGMRGKPNKEWLGDIKEWCQMDMHSASILAQSRTKWRQFVKRVVDTNGY